MILPVDLDDLGQAADVLRNAAAFVDDVRFCKQCTVDVATYGIDGSASLAITMRDAIRELTALRAACLAALPLVDGAVANQLRDALGRDRLP